MSKRKITGILQYGTRKYNKPVQKLQAGGYVSFAKAYDWRDDPYEIMLLQQKAAQDNAYARGSGSRGGRGSGASSGTANKNIDTFARIKGGLRVTNENFNARVQKDQEEYYNQITSGALDPGSAQGQIAFQRLVNEHGRLEEIAVKEEANFTDALSKIDVEDRQTLAISSDGNAMVWDLKGIGQKIPMSKYLDNVDKYQIMKIDEFADWKSNKDTGLQAGYTDEFLKKNAVGYNTLKKTYIDGKEDLIQYAFLNGKIVKKNNSDDSGAAPIVDIAQFKTGLNNLLSGKDFYSESNGTIKPESRTNIYMEIANNLYSDIMSNSAIGSRLEASLTAELLSDKRQIDHIYGLRTTKEKENYLEEQKRFLLANKLVDKNFKLPKTVQDSGAGDSSSKAKANSLTADMGSFFDSSEVSRFVFGKGIATPGGTRIADLSLPVVKDGLSPADILGVTDPKASPDEKRRANNYYHNKAIHTRADTTDVYSAGGVNFKQLLPSNEAVKDFIANDTVIAPNETMPMMLVPMDGNGKIRVKDMMELVSLKMDSKRRFLASVKGKINITTRAEDLLPGNLDPKAASDAREYQRWVKKGFDINKYQANFDKDKSAENLANLKMAKDSFEVIKQTSAAFSKKFGNNPIRMQPMLGTWIIFDDNKANIKEAMDKNPASIGNSMIYPASDSDIKYLQEVNGVDHTSWVPFTDDNIYKTMVFSKIKSLGKVSAEKGEKMVDAAQQGDIWDKMLNTLSGNSSASNPSRRNIALFLMQ